MQKQSFDKIPYMYRPYDFTSQFPILAFIGDNWKTDISTPKFLHFHNNHSNFIGDINKQYTNEKGYLSIYAKVSYF